MKRLTIPAAVAGLCLLAVLLAANGIEGVVEAIRHAGIGAGLAVVVLRAVAVATGGVGWRFLFPRDAKPSAALCVGLRFVREGINQLLPAAQVGGELVAARLLTFARQDSAVSGATLIVDLVVQASTQILFGLLGLAIVITDFGDVAIVRTVGIALLIAAGSLGCFLLVQKGSGSRWLGDHLRRAADSWDWLGAAGLERLRARLGETYRRPGAVLSSGTTHMAVWIGGSLEVWVVLRALGYEISFPEALAIESLSHAIRGAAFIVPGAYGVQEASLVALCALFGVPAQPALALSLLKRVADLAVGIPGLLGWQFAESRRALGRGGAGVAKAPPGVEMPSGAGGHP